MQLAATVIVINLLCVHMILDLLEQLVTNLYNVDVPDLSTLNKQSKHMSLTSCMFLHIYSPKPKTIFGWGLPMYHTHAVSGAPPTPRQINDS